MRVEGSLNWTKENLENALMGAYNKSDVLRALGKNWNNYSTLNKYLAKYALDYSHLKPKCVSYKANNPLKIYSKGDKHPDKDLYFWQYRFDRLNSNSFEQWYDKETYDKACATRKIVGKRYVRKKIFFFI